MQRLIMGVALAGAFIASSVVPINAQSYGYNQLPPGSYQQSCSNISMHGSTLSASCTAASGGRVNSSLNVNRCGGANVINSNGYLQCSGGGYYNGSGSYNGNGSYNGGHRYNGGGYGNGQNGYGYGYGALPPGSYQNSCTNERMNGSTLSANCTAASGGRVYSSLNVNGCGGGNVINSNGYLQCSGYGSNNGYNNGGYNGYGNGNDNYNNGHHHHHHYNSDDNDQANGNGYGYGYGNGSLPAGLYQNSCTNIRMNGSTLSASCTSGSGQRVYSSINANRCQSVRNDNGYLRCS